MREVDRLVAVGAWDDLLFLRERCLAAAEETGRQLWGAAQYAEYRAALEAPPEVAGPLIVPGAARHALGPLTEVVSQAHSFEELAYHLPSDVSTGLVAQERVVRGEDLTEAVAVPRHDIDVPLVRQPWEPRYAVPVYRADEVLEDGPPVPRLVDAVDAAPGQPVDRSQVVDALVALVAPWAVSPNGEVHAVAVRGTAAAAVAALRADDVAMARVTLPGALARLVWAAGTGGAQARRRGMAAARSATWWFLHELAEVEAGSDPDDLEFLLEEHGWFVFGDADERGYRLQVAVEAPDGTAIAIDAVDLPDDEDEADDADDADEAG